MTPGDFDPASGSPAAPGPRADEGARRVLYVEDNSLNVLLMESMLALRPQWQLQVAGDVASGEAAALAFAPHLVLTDMQLPDAEGTELLQRLRRHEGLRGVPVIAVSANAMADDIRAATAAGFDGYWTKPLDMHQVLRELERLLA